MKLKLNQQRPDRGFMTPEQIDLIVKNNADIISALLESTIYPNAGQILIKTGNKMISAVSEWEIKSFINSGGSLANVRLLKKQISTNHEEKGEKDNNSYVIKFDTSRKKDKLAREISWILNLDKDILKLFPELVYYNLDFDTHYYIIPFYKKYTPLNILFSNKITSKNKLDSILSELLDLVFNNIYTKKGRGEVKDQIKHYHLDRVENRLEETVLHCPQFRKLIEAEKLKINGVEYENVAPIIKKIKKDKRILEKLKLRTSNLTHGDLHFGNILYSKEKEDLRFKLIDPGAHEASNFTYDIGKLYHSFYGLYDTIYLNRFELKEKSDTLIDITLDIETNQNYNYIKKNFKNILENKKFKLLEQEPDWELKSLFAQACHFCSMMPFHIKDVAKAKAIYLQGVILLNEVMVKLNK